MADRSGGIAFLAVGRSLGRSPSPPLAGFTSLVAAIGISPRAKERAVKLLLAVLSIKCARDCPTGLGRRLLKLLYYSVT